MERASQSVSRIRSAQLGVDPSGGEAFPVVPRSASPCLSLFVPVSVSFPRRLNLAPDMVVQEEDDEGATDGWGTVAGGQWPRLQCKLDQVAKRTMREEETN